jgi:hypothetical protein
MEEVTYSKPMVLVKYWRVCGIGLRGRCKYSAGGRNYSAVWRICSLKRRISGVMAHLLVMLTQLTGRTAQS